MMASLEDRVSAMERVLGMEDGKVGPEGHLGAVVRSHTRSLDYLKMNQAQHSVMLNQLWQEQKRQAQVQEAHSNTLNMHTAVLNDMRAEMKGLHAKQDRLLEMLTNFVNPEWPNSGR
ncbi:hypothetical protein LWF15_16350 [Kineosporia rhizophila]|uniref:hypothetical protein n=1 Tax=Kineosporia rhizophila TaxID=84633 RepID=UPI000A6442B6|nr:hypothetical protein [Kineosporia rhizophila]MCE0537074.1 hypothetical protein [Kineosporia rhizophila]